MLHEQEHGIAIFDSLIIARQEIIALKLYIRVEVCVMPEWRPSFKYVIYTVKHTPTRIKEFYRDVSIRVIHNIGLLFKEKYGHMPARPDHDELIASMIISVYRTMEEYKSVGKTLTDIVKIKYGDGEIIGFRINKEFIMYFTIMPRGFFRKKGIFMINIYDERLLDDQVSIETIMESDEIILLSEKMLEELSRLTLSNTTKYISRGRFGIGKDRKTII